MGDLREFSRQETVTELQDAVDLNASITSTANIVRGRARDRGFELVTELGGAEKHKENRAAWAADLRQSLPVVRRLGFPVAFWAYTYGGHWRLQPGESPNPHPEFRAVMGG